MLASSGRAHLAGVVCLMASGATLGCNARDGGKSAGADAAAMDTADGRGDAPGDVSASSGDRPVMSLRGASLPFFEYEAENARTTGSIIGPSRAFGDVAGEASGRRAVRLETTGQSVQFRTEHPTNSIVVRYAIPDAPAGGGTKATLGLYIDGTRKADLPLDSRYAWTYGDADAQGAMSDKPANGTPHHFYDEVHVMFESVQAGSTIALQRDSQDTAAYYVIDLVDFEQVAPPLSRPPDSLSIVDFGATSNDGSDDGPAIQRAIDAAKAQNKVLWIPVGTFASTTVPLNVSGVTIRGAGMWYSTLQGFWAQFKVSGNSNRFFDFAIFGDVIARDDQRGDNAFDGPAGTGSRLENVWIEHQKVGWWVGKGSFSGQITQPLTDGLIVHGVRIRNVLADGINFANATRNSVVEQSHFRNTGDDSLATWSYAGDGPLPCENDVFRFNTIQTVWRATCIATYGGKDIKIEDNLCADTSNYPGIMIATTFQPIAPSGTTTVQRNSILRGGGPHYGQEFGAFRIFADQTPISNVEVRDLVIEDATFAGIHFGGSQRSTGITLDDVQIRNAGTNAIWIAAESQGSAHATNLTVQAPAGQALKNEAPSSFTLTKGTGNTGW